ncbi:MAG: septum formation inhibitor Maf [Allomuricauda sp.]|nr:MAG: septum formation inhibitor Maf [Allomuricauda sp.]
MKKWIRFELLLVFFALVITAFEGCKENSTSTSKELAITDASDLEVPTVGIVSKPKAVSQAFKKYWYSGKAEITSYKLKQARYGEIREGKSALIFVTEPFLPGKQVKADRNNPDNVSVLKLNATKKYLTGIYPYSIMSSTFYPVGDNQHALKTSLSVQEWCGHVYAQLNNRETFEYTAHSYFESEADEQASVGKALLENEIWNKIRVNPENLPLGSIEIIPSLEFFRLRHLDLKAFSATASMQTENGITSYSIDYKDIERKLTIDFSESFPYEIEGWTEEFKSGYGPNAKLLKSTGTKLNRIRTAYWGQNSNKDVFLRDSLGL